MYFSLIEPDPRHARIAAHERMHGAYDDHRWLWERFFPAPPGTPRDFLYRRLDGDAGARYCTVSARAPAAGVPGWRVQAKPYDPKLEAGERLAFELRANPVVTRPGSPVLAADGTPVQREGGRRSGAPKHKSTRHDVVMDAKKRLLAARGLLRWQDWRSDDRPPVAELVRDSCSRWLADCAPRHGFAVEPHGLRVDAYAQHRAKDGAMRFSSVDFAGELMVTDAAAFREALANGVGRAKAFGCGLLLVRRLG